MEEFSADILNYALMLSTEWGENFRKPIEGRMLERFPGLSETDLKRIKKTVTDAEYYIYSLAEDEMEGKISLGDIGIEVRQRFPWIDPTQLGRLTNIGMFYARK